MTNLIEIIKSVVVGNPRFFDEEIIGKVILAIKQNKLSSFSKEDIDFLSGYYSYEKVHVEILTIMMIEKTKKTETELTISDLNVLSLEDNKSKRSFSYLMSKLTDNMNKISGNSLNDYHLLNDDWKNEESVATLLVGSKLFKDNTPNDKKDFLSKLNKNILSSVNFLNSLLLHNYVLFLDEKQAGIYDIVNKTDVIEIIKSQDFKNDINEEVNEYGRFLGLTHLFSKLSADDLSEADLFDCYIDGNLIIFKRKDIIDKLKGNEHVLFWLKGVVESEFEEQSLVEYCGSIETFEEWEDIVSKYN